MRHALQVGDHRCATDVLAERDGERRVDLVVGFGSDDLAEGNELPFLVRYLETHDRLAGDHLDHAHADGRERPGEVLGEAADLARLDARCRTQLKACDHGTRQHGHHLDLDAEIFELELDETRHGLERLGRIGGFAHLRVVEQLQGGQLARLGVEQWHLPLFLDALALLRLRRGGLDARLRARGGTARLDLGVTLADGATHLAFGDVLRLEPACAQPVDAAPEATAQTVDDTEPRDPESKRHTDHPDGEQQQRPADEVEVAAHPVADHAAEHATRTLTQRPCAPVQRGECTTRREHHHEAADP